MSDIFPLFTTDQWASIQRGIGQEITEVQKDGETTWLELDGIEELGRTSGGLRYRLLVSNAPRVSAEQVLNFHIRGGDTVTAKVIEARDQELVVICDKKLPADARLLRLSFDPTFIYRALEKFLESRRGSGNRLARCIVNRQFPSSDLQPTPIEITPFSGLNVSQQSAVKGIVGDELHLLWGPPGTGKTTTLGSAVAMLAQKGQRILILSTSNTAVDVALKAVIENRQQAEMPRAWIQRIGASEDRVVSSFTEVSDPSAVRVSGCTLAKLLLDEDVHHNTYDYVVVDEVSMVGLLHIVAAASLNCKHLVCAGDPMQLPPICQSQRSDALTWLGQNIYDWFGIDEESRLDSKPVTFLDTQHRMTKTIGDLVSVTGYAGKLKTGRADRGAPVEFIDIPSEWQRTFFSVSQSSYFHPLAVVLLHEICPYLGGDNDVLLLSPFRPQQALLAAIGFDLAQKIPGQKLAASTIHRAQGGERRCVILDLTTHDPSKLVRFFEDRHAERLINVAISRAKDRLLIIGNKAMLHRIAANSQGTTRYWKELLLQFDQSIQAYSASDIVSPVPWSDVKEQLRSSGSLHKPVMICTEANGDELDSICKMATELKGSRKVVVAKTQPPLLGDYIARTNEDCPPLMAAGDVLAIPLDKQWLYVNSPSVTKVIWRIGFNHLVESEVSLSDLAAAFDCPNCKLVQGLVIGYVGGMGTRLICLNRSSGCFHERPLSVAAARMKARASGMACSHRHPITVRSGPKGLFLACENYPRCDWSESIRLLEGM